ncbi:MAG: AAA family ATPase [Gemmataceae bacterium]
MFRSFTVENFRCFRELTLEPLERINLIAGKNNTGKTALLEAIHLHSYPRSCELPFLVNQRRKINGDRKPDNTSCEWMFFDKKGTSGIRLRSANAQGEPRTLQMWFVDPTTAKERFVELSDLMRQEPLRQWWSGSDCLILKANTTEQETIAIAWPQPTGLFSFGSNPTPCNGASVFFGSAGRSAKDDAAAFSDLEVANRQEEILPPLRILEPRLQRLSILLLADEAILHGHIGLSRLVPLPFMGEGIRRLLSILLAINQAKGGNILIDEVENGLHHSVMVPVWQAIAEAARRADVQVFATTHSYECIQAAQQAFQPQGADVLRLFRLDRIQDQIRFAEYDKEVLNYAIEMNHEVR